MSIQFSVDVNGEHTRFPHYWELCVGSCHASMANREDWRKQLKKAHEELGFKYVRFHGILDDDMSVCVREHSYTGEPGKLRYSFYNVDSVIDFLLEIGMKPFVEFGFMPEALASGRQTCFHYKGNVNPPADYGQWEKLISGLVRHWADRYGIDELREWFFEVWNEPNLPFFWAGSREEYFKLYRSTALAVKNVDGKLRVGGPATSINAWIPEMIEYCNNTHTPLDFVSTHHYPTDDPLWKNSDLSMEEFFKLHGSEFGKYERGILYKMTSRAKAECGDIPLYYTEWNSSAMLPDPLHDESYSAALIAKTIADNDGLVESYSFWTFSDLFEESGQLSGPFHGGFGLQTIHGIPKPSYRLFELMHQLGDKRLKVESGGHETVEMLATISDEEIMLMVNNHQIPGEAIDKQNVTVHVHGLDGCGQTNIVRIDDDHVNPKKRWIELGRADYPDKETLKKIYDASIPVYENMDTDFNRYDGALNLSFCINPDSVVFIKIPFR